MRCSLRPRARTASCDGPRREEPEVLAMRTVRATKRRNQRHLKGRTLARWADQITRRPHRAGVVRA